MIERIDDDHRAASVAPVRIGGLSAQFIFVTIILDTTAFGLVFPVIPTLIRIVAHSSMARTAEIYGAFAMLFGLIQLFASPMQGALSDHFGRRPVLVASSLGLGSDYLIMALAPNLVWLLAGRLISAVAAGSVSASAAYVTDTSAPDRRAARFGQLAAALASGTAIGYGLGGLLTTIDLRAPFWAAGGLSITNGLLAFVLLRESLPPERRTRFTWRGANPVGVIFGLCRSYPSLTRWIAVALLIGLCTSGLAGLIVLFTGQRFGWTPRDIGPFLAAFAVGLLLVQGVLVGPAVRRFGERVVLFGGLILVIAGLASVAIVSTWQLFAASMVLICLGSAANPVQVSLMAAAVGPFEQGRLQGAIRSAASLAGMIGPGLFAFTFAWGIGASRGRDLTGAPFVVAAGLLTLAAPIAWLATRRAQTRSVV
ncbi:MAG: MFS transporter [Caulobacterales bacterium]